VAYPDAGVLVVSQRKIGRHGRDAGAVRGLQTPGLAAQELPFAALQVQPVKPQTISMTIRGNEHVAGVVAVEVKLDIATDDVLAEFGVGPATEPGVLTGLPVFGEMAGYGVAVGNRAEVGGRHVAGVGGAEDVLKVHEPARREIGRADAE